MPRRPLQEASRPIVRRQEMGQERAWHGQGVRGDFGLAASDRIPVASAEQIDARYCLRFLRHIRDCSFATVDAEGLPAVRVIDVMHVEDGRLFFLAPRGKEFYREILRNPVVAIVGQTTDFRTCRLRGRAVRAADGEQKALVDRMFELNPSMDQLYPAESRYACEVFCIEDGSGEYFDLGQKPIVRVPFAIGRASLDAKGAFEVSEGCEGCVARAEDGTFRIDQGACLRCGLCEEACPHGAIFRSAGCADGWTRENRASTWCSTSS